ncbi:MAG: PQQ-binding-like beta-propeller repeat protein [Planctomycetota bacterium]
MRARLVAGAAGLLLVAAWILAGDDRPAPPPAEAAPPRRVEIDLDRAVPIPTPEIRRDLKPVAFGTSDGKEGWVVRIPGGRPIATPAYAGGLLFVGGGYGSHEFYALDAGTGEVRWRMKTSDDGPTAAVVEPSTPRAAPSSWPTPRRGRCGGRSGSATR